MSNLSFTDLSVIRENLSRQLQRLSSTAKSLETEALQGLKAESVGEVSHMPQHIADVGDLTASQNVDLTLASAEMREVTEIRRALEKLSFGNFGFCERCGLEIPKERLMAIPSARFCMNCEREMERIENLRKKPNDQRPYIRPMEEEKEIPY